ncbi:MAG: double zinc ribbon domain-containing protein [Spirochaetia bacterium]
MKGRAEKVRPSFSATGRLILETLFPGRCLLCGQWLLLASDHGAPLCAACETRLAPLGADLCARCGIQLVSEQGTCLRCREAEYAFEANIAIFANSGPAKILVRSLKFEGRNRLAPFFAGIVSSVLRERGRLFPLIPVPPRPGRRTPDPAELIARCLARNHGIRVQRLLSRSGGAEQKSLNFQQRKENLSGQMRLAPWAAPGMLPDEVVLLDDVFTTGATLDACARALRAAGCKRVYGVTLVIEE